MKVLTVIEQMLETFKNDPADSDYQRGYEACLKELRRIAAELEGEDA